MSGLRLALERLGQSISTTSKLLLLLRKVKQQSTRADGSVAISVIFFVNAFAVVQVALF
jgi:hypothetical protein